MATAPRERGWLRLLLAVVLALSIPLVAQLRVIVPVEQTVLFIAPSLAACALVGWTRGARWWLFVAWGIMAFWILAMRPAADSSFDVASRAWSLLTAAAFGIVGYASRSESFFPRALAATGLSLCVALGIAVAGRSGVSDVGRTVAEEYSRRLDAVTLEYEQRSRSAEWQSFAQRYPRAAEIVAEGEKQLPKMAGAAIAVFPALLALESLALLALAWTLYHRASRTRIGAPLSRLADFRFNDQLIWGLVLGVTLVVLPSMAEARPIGLNLAAFFGALYVLRGLGVLVWFWSPSGRTPVLLVLATIIAGPAVGALALGLGLADTWIDWRGRVRPPA